MILSEKIMSLRKRNGWSQEELAEQLDVSRQSVSKWESGVSIPDIEKIIKMSQLFSVSTDYLLKDGDDDEDIRVGSPVIETASENSNTRFVSMEEATDYMELCKDVANKIAAGVVACILSPVVLILMSTYSELPGSALTEGMAAATGLVVLFALIAAGVLTFIVYGMKLDKYKYLETDEITLKYGVESVVMRKKEGFEPAYRASVAAGVILCIFATVPLIIAGCMEQSDMICVLCIAVMFLIISVAVYLFVSKGMIYGSYNKLLQEGEYTKKEKRNKSRYEKIWGAYWCLATAVYLGWSFYTDAWYRTWIVWPVAAVLFAAFKALVEAIGEKNQSAQ